MAKPPFPIPKPWQSGLAIPGYMQNEGLREGAFVTHPTPRGTYDDPNPFDPSWDKTYAVPKYVLAEGYGQGARVTHWPARGTYVGATKGQAKKATLKALGDVDGPTLPGAYARYGQRAARAIMLRLQAVAPDKRRAELKRLMDAIDPSLWSRTETGANKLVARGVPAPKAIEAALARAMGSGVAAEILELGTSKSLPKARSLLGLGCYGCAGVVAALGDVAALKAITSPITAIASVFAPSSSSGSGLQCSADGKFVWVNDHWERIRAGQTCATFVPAGTTPTVRDQRGGSGGGVTVTDASGQTVKTTVTTPTSTSIDLLKVGPWLLRNKEGEKIGISKALLTPEQLQLINKALLIYAAKSGAIWPTSGGVKVNLKDYGWGLDIKLPTYILDDFFPVARFVHPETGKKCAVYVRFLNIKKSGSAEAQAAGTAPRIEVKWGEWKSTWEKIIGFLVELVAAIVKPILEELGNLACQLVGDPSVAAGTTIAAGAAATAGGGPAAGGAAASGVAIAQNLCGGGAPPPPPPEESSFPILPVAIAGGAVLAIAAFWPKKKRT